MVVFSLVLIAVLGKFVGLSLTFLSCSVWRLHVEGASSSPAWGC